MHLRFHTELLHAVQVSTAAATNVLAHNGPRFLHQPLRLRGSAARLWCSKQLRHTEGPAPSGAIHAA